MSNRDPNLMFEILEPPAGGLTRLRARIRQDQVRRVRNSRLTVAGAGMAVVAVVALAAGLFPGPAPVLLPGLESDLLAIQAGMVEPPAEPVSIPPALRRDFAVQRIPTSDDKVIFYLVGSR